MPVQFTVTGYPDREFNGRVTRINPTADPVTRQVTVFAEIPNPGGTLVGDLFAEGRIATEQRTALVVPNAAIERKLMKPAVMKVDRGTVKRVEVTLGINDPQSGRVEITSGVIAGDTLLSGPAMQISEGTRVRTTGPAGTPTAAQVRQTP
jgi:multidrug efflux pump subunit AcrA (membrane-fusion protein)